MTDEELKELEKFNNSEDLKGARLNFTKKRKAKFYPQNILKAFIGIAKCIGFVIIFWIMFYILEYFLYFMKTL